MSCQSTEVSSEGIARLPSEITNPPYQPSPWSLPTEQDLAIIEWSEEGAQEVLLKLSGRNKQSLLQQACEAVFAGRPKAEITLQRMQGLNPGLSECLRVKEAAIFDFPIRLLYQAKDDASSLTEVSSYLAISYCWRNESWTPACAGPNLAPWPFTECMVNAVRNLREDHEGIWIDAQCIDQDNAGEKRLAIGSMDIIYRSARRLVIVMEDVQLSKEEQATALSYARLSNTWTPPGQSGTAQQLESTWKENFRPSPEEYSSIAKFVYKMLSARWFQRAWCSHEYKVRPKASKPGPIILVFGCDGEVLHFEYLFLFILIWYLSDVDKQSIFHKEFKAKIFNQVSDNKTNAELDLAIYPNIGEIILRFKNMQESPTLSLTDQLRATLSFECSVPDDRIAITLNIRGANLFFKGHIERLEECYWVINAIALAAGDLSPLRSSGPKVRLQVGGKPFNSWIQQRSSEHESQTSLFNTGCITSVTQEFIQLDLLVICSIPRPPTESSQQAATLLIKDGSLDTRNHSTGPDHAQEHTKRILNILGKSEFRKYSSQWLVLFLACALDCGIDWIRSFGRLLQVQVAKEAWYLGKLPLPDENFCPEALSLLSSQGITNDDSITFREEYLDPVILFLTYVTDDRLKDTLIMPRLIATSSSGHYALTNINYGRFYFAVPVALADSPFFHNQVWLLEPLEGPKINEDGQSIPPAPTSAQGYYANATCDIGDSRSPLSQSGRWRLMGKEKLIGCPPLIADNIAVRGLKSQKVYG